MLCFHAQYKECLSLSWNADLSFFLITITCSYISIRAIAQQSLARLSPGFSEAQTFHKKAISGMRLHLSLTLYWYYLPYHLWLQMPLPTHTEPLFGEKIMGWALVLLVWDTEDFSCSASIPSSKFATFPSLMTWPLSFSLNEQIILKNEQMFLWWQRSSQGVFTSGSVYGCCTELILSTKQLGKMSL